MLASTRPNRLALSGLLAAALLTLAACGEGGSPPPLPPRIEPSAIGTPVGAPVTAIIGPSGGVLSSADGKLRLEIPASALSKAETLSLQEITNTAPGGFGKAFRLGPEGSRFAKPVRLEFRFSGAELQGADQQSIRVAYQTQEGYWTPLHTSSPDALSVSATTDHFSDWSPVAGAQLDPLSATAKVGQNVNFTVKICETVVSDDPRNPLDLEIIECQPSVVVARLLRDWSVNQTVGGSAAEGTVTQAEPGRAVYTAPAKLPIRNPVAVSVRYKPLAENTESILVANITVLDDTCGAEGCWTGSIIYREAGSATTPPRPPATGQIESSYSYDETQTVTGVAEAGSGYVQLKLQATSSGSYQLNGYTREEPGTCTRYILEHWWTAEENVSGQAAVGSTLEISPSGYILNFSSAGANGTRKDTDRKKLSAQCPPPDPSYERSDAWESKVSQRGTNLSLEVKADPSNPDHISGQKRFEGSRAGVPIQGTITWEFTRRR